MYLKYLFLFIFLIYSFMYSVAYSWILSVIDLFIYIHIYSCIHVFTPLFVYFLLICSLTYSFIHLRVCVFMYSLTHLRIHVHVYIFIYASKYVFLFLCFHGTGVGTLGFKMSHCPCFCYGDSPIICPCMTVSAIPLFSVLMFWESRGEPWSAWMSSVQPHCAAQTLQWSLAWADLATERLRHAHGAHAGLHSSDQVPHLLLQPLWLWGNVIQEAMRASSQAPLCWRPGNHWWSPVGGRASDDFMYVLLAV
jgi:hypothetical protein